MSFPVHDRKAIEELEAIRANLLRLEYLTVHLCEELEAIKHILKPHLVFLLQKPNQGDFPNGSP